MHLLSLDYVPPIFGQVQNPLNQGSYGGLSGIGPFITNVIRLLFVVAGIYALFNFIIAGYEYISAGGDSKKLERAWARIWQSLLGLVIMVASFAIISLFGYVIFGSGFNILSPVIYGPGQ